MEPNLLQTQHMRKFRSEADYRLWQHELAASIRPVARRQGLASRVANLVREWAAQDTNSQPEETEQWVQGRPVSHKA